MNPLELTYFQLEPRKYINMLVITLLKWLMILILSFETRNNSNGRKYLLNPRQKSTVAKTYLDLTRTSTMELKAVNYFHKRALS